MFSHRHTRVQRVRDVVADIGFVVDKRSSIHNRRRYVRVMDASTNETCLILFEIALTENRSGSTVLGCLVIDPNATAVGSIAGKRHVRELGVRSVVDYGAAATRVRIDVDDISGLRVRGRHTRDTGREGSEKTTPEDL